MTAVPGGRYVRDTKTGKLTKVSEDAPVNPPPPPASKPSNPPAPPASDAARKGK